MNSTLEPVTQRRPWRSPVRCGAVALWCSFLGAVLSTLLLLAAAPQTHMEDAYALDVLTRWFLLSWLIGLLPVGFAMMLVASPPSDHRR